MARRWARRWAAASSGASAFSVSGLALPSLAAGTTSGWRGGELRRRDGEKVGKKDGGRSVRAGILWTMCRELYGRRISVYILFCVPSAFMSLLLSAIACSQAVPVPL